MTVNHAVAKGAAWMLFFKFAERSLGFVSVLVLARILLPADFGIVAMAMSVIALIELATSFSFELSLIQNQHPTRDHYDTAWTLQVAFGAACAMVTGALAHPAAWFYAEPRLLAVLYALAGGWLLQSFENIGVVDFRRNMQFNRDVAFLASKKLIAFTVTISLALLLRSYWALVAGTLAGRATGIVLSYAMQPYRPRFSLKARRDLFSFSLWICANNVVGFATARLAQLVIGRLHGSTILGLYTVGSEIAYLPATDLVAPINRVLFPGYAQMTTNRASLRDSYLNVLSLIAVAALPMSFGIAAVARPVVRVLLGERWMAAVPLIQILGFAGAVHAVDSNATSLWLALGKARTAAVVNVLYLVALVPLIAALSHIAGVIGIAYAELSAVAFATLVSYTLISRELQLRPVAYITRLWRPLAAAAAMSYTVTASLAPAPEQAGVSGPLAWLSVAVPLGAVTYLAALALCGVSPARRAGPSHLHSNVSPRSSPLCANSGGHA